MRRLVVTLGLVAAAGTACTGAFPVRGSTARISVELQPPIATGTRAQPLPLAIEYPAAYGVKVRVLKADGTQDAAFTGQLRLSVKPGSVQSVSGPGVEGRNVLVTAGESAPVNVNILGAYGETHILAEDLGYVPTDPRRDPPAACSDGKDNDGDGRFDYPADEGCAFANDDSETGGTYTAGASEAIFYALPRVADVRGVSQGGAATSFPKQQIQIDTGFDELNQRFVFTTIVTRIASDGFYVTDVDDAIEQRFTPPASYQENKDKKRADGQKPRGASSVFAFTFNAPPGMRVCDRIKTYRGTAIDFFGFTEIGFPTFTLEEWDPRLRPCGLPEPYVLRPDDLSSQALLFQNLSGLVRVQTLEKVETRVTRHFGPGDTPCTKRADGSYQCAATDDASNCDFNKDGRVDFTKEPEKSCSAACAVDLECTEYSNFAARSAFQLVVTDTVNGLKAKIQADGSTSPSFLPLDLRGKAIRAFTGTLRYFSGGAQFTLEARCKDDIIIDLAAPLVPMDRACVFPRQLIDLNSGTQ